MNYVAEFLLGAPPATMLLLKITGVLVVACLLNPLLARGNPRWSVLMWRGTLLGLVVLAAGEVYTPKLVIAINVPAPSVLTGNVPDVVSVLLPQVDSVAESHRAPDIVSVNPPPATAEVAASTQPVRLTLIAWVMLHRAPLLLACWLGVAGILLMRMLAVAWRVRRATSIASKAPCDILELVTGIARDLGCKPSVDVRTMAGLGSPYLAGIARPIIILPERILTEASRHELSAILAHELTHVKSRDIAWLLFNRIATSILWFHPLAWRMLAAHGAACEGVCDAVAAEYIGDREAYSRTLARTALAVASGAPSGGLPMVRGSKVLRRIRAVGRGVRAVALPRSRVAASVVLGVLLLGGGLSVSFVRAESEANDSAATVGPQRIPELELVATLTGRVYGPQGEFVEGAPVQAIASGDGETERRQTTTDSAGLFQFESLTPDTKWYISVDDPRFAQEWECERSVKIPVDGSLLPLKIQLQPPHELSGVVVDESKQPIGGVRITVRPRPGSDNGDPTAWREHPFVREEKTDAQGRFSIDRLRPGTIDVLATHNDYAVTRASGLLIGESGHQIVLDRGRTLEGTVTSGGRPLEGVTLDVRASGFGDCPSCSQWTATTNEQGAFEVHHIPGRVTFGVDAVSVDLVGDEWTAPTYTVVRYPNGGLPSVQIEAEPKSSSENLSTDRQAEAEQGGIATPPGDGLLTVTLAEPRSAYSDGKYPVVSVHGAEDHVYVQGMVDKNGVAKFGGLRPGTYTIYVDNRPSEPNGNPHYPAQEFALKAGEPWRATLKKGSAKLSGRIQGAETPRKWKRLSWTVYPPTYSSYEQGEAFLFDDGRYVIDGLVPGDYRLIFEGTYTMSNETAVVVAEGDNVHDISLPVGRIEGRLVGASPAPDDEPYSVFVNAKVELGFNLSGSVNMVVDEEGRFHLDHIPPGAYRIQMRGARPNELVWSDVTVPDTPEAVLVELRRAEKSGEIAGVVRGQDAFEHDENLELVVSAAFFRDSHYDLGIVYMAPVAGADGSYRFQNLPEGQYLLRLHSVKNALPQWFAVGVAVNNGLCTPVDIDVPEGRRVAIGVERSENTAWRFWALRLTEGASIPELNLRYPPIGTVFSGSGNAPNLPLGKYVVEAEFSNGMRVEQPIEVVKGEGIQRFIIPMPQK